MLSLIVLNGCKSSRLELKEGDLLFKQKIVDNFSEAIVSATESIDSYNFTHIGITHNIKGKWYVIEAVSKGVCLTEFDNFIGDSSIIVLGRLIDEYQNDIPPAINSIMKTVGKPYDNYFMHGNEAFYCSELVQEYYLHEGKPIFPAVKMTFKDLETGKFPKYWIEHFAALNTPIPEGELGSNPGDLSKSDKIIILGRISRIK